MQKSLASNSSARKKLLDYQQDLKREQSQSGYLGRTLSRQHSKFMQNVLRQGLQRQQSQRAIKRQYQTKGYTSNEISRTPSSNKKLNIQTSSLNNSINLKFKPLLTSKSNKYDQIRIDNPDDIASSIQNNNQQNRSNIPQFMNQTDQIRSARQNQLMEVKRLRFQFSFWKYIIEVGIGYGLFIGILYLIQAGGFPYFEVILILALTMTIRPWKISTLLFLIAALPITIVNFYTGLATLTYVEILIAYLAAVVFNQRHKVKVIFILAIVLQIVFGFVILPNYYQAVKNNTYIYIYTFPLFIFVLRSCVQLGYWIIGYSQGLFLQIPLFLMGLEYGTVMSVDVGQIEFWYLLVFFTLQVMNERTQFFLSAMIKLVKFCFPKMRTTPTPDYKKLNNHILAAHWNGFSAIHSFHIVACIYILTQLSLYASPYSSNFFLSSYTSTQWYKPLIVWALISVYQIMCLVLEKGKQNIILVGYTNNRWYMVIARGVIMVLGLWMFYMGLGVGLYCSARLI